MGKDRILPISRSRLFSPWHSDDVKSTSLDSEIKMDKAMTDIIHSIEQHQIERMKQLKEETEEDILMLQAQCLGISNSESTPFQLCQEDHAMSSYYTTEQALVVTLAEAITDKEAPTEYGLYSTDPQVRFVYNSIGEYFSTYVSGCIPKAFKIVPSLANWDFVLLLTMPHLWTAAATLEATKVFLTFIRAKQTKLFLQYVLLPNFRNHATKYGTLEGPMFLALVKALQTMPSLFIKGFLLPLIESNCSILEASLVATLLKEYKIPVHPTATALNRLSELKFSLPAAILVSVLLKKKQALPYRTVDVLVARYFAGVLPDGAQQPVPHIWYQTLFEFTRNYHMDLIAPQKQKLLHFIEIMPPHELTKSIQATLTLSESEIAYSSEDDGSSSEMMSE